MVNARRLGQIPILMRLLIANAIVIVIGASIGTMLTKMLVDQSAFSLAVAFTAAGVTLSLLLNYFVLRLALRPLNTLSKDLDAIGDGGLNGGAMGHPVTVPVNQDPDITRLAEALNAMLERLALHTATIEANRQQLRALSTQVIKAQEEERKRIARELHDETCQSLASLLIALDRVYTAIPSELPQVRANLSSAHQLANRTLDGIRTLVADLRPLLLDDLGLLPAIRWYAREHLESQGIDVDLQAPADMPRLPSTMETALFRIAQEAITNIVRHADASQVRITLGCDCQQSPNCKLRLLIEDDGVGFDAQPAGLNNFSGRFGLFGIRERTAALGGDVKLDSAIGQGTRLCVTLPLEGKSTDEPGHTSSIGG